MCSPYESLWNEFTVTRAAAWIRSVHPFPALWPLVWKCIMWLVGMNDRLSQNQQLLSCSILVQKFRYRIRRWQPALNLFQNKGTRVENSSIPSVFPSSTSKLELHTVNACRDTHTPALVGIKPWGPWKVFTSRDHLVTESCGLRKTRLCRQIGLEYRIAKECYCYKTERPRVRHRHGNRLHLNNYLEMIELQRNANIYTCSYTYCWKEKTAQAFS